MHLVKHHPAKLRGDWRPKSDVSATQKGPYKNITCNICCCVLSPPSKSARWAQRSKAVQPKKKNQKKQSRSAIAPHHHCSHAHTHTYTTINTLLHMHIHTHIFTKGNMYQMYLFSLHARATFAFSTFPTASFSRGMSLCAACD